MDADVIINEISDEEITEAVKKGSCKKENESEDDNDKNEERFQQKMRLWKVLGLL